MDGEELFSLADDAELSQRPTQNDDVIERARSIRDQLLANASERWCQGSVAGMAVPTLKTGDVTAVLWSKHQLGALADDASLHPVVGVDQCKFDIALYSMDVWVKDRCVLSLSWNAIDEVTVTSMERGSWEVVHFQLALPDGEGRPTIH